jgi:hypothetical protein
VRDAALARLDLVDYPPALWITLLIESPDAPAAIAYNSIPKKRS